MVDWWQKLDFSAQGWSRVFGLTALGTLCCIAIAFTIDSFSFEEWRWRLGTNPINDLIIPLVIAPPFFCYLLTKLRQLAIAHDRLLAFATTDGLTSCLTRAAFTSLVDAYLERVAGRTERNTGGALFVVDVDHFKRINDGFGHDVGDEALKLVVKNIGAALREFDLIGRLGGEEFGLFLPGLPADQAEMVAHRIRIAVMTTQFTPGGTPFVISISLGGVTFGTDASFSELYKVADQRLYHAKRSGRNRVAITHINVPAVSALH
ncbi:GGDEF domain-containing protein [Mesorhizobium loti]|uniref:GGDEF domain-containing protein n=1 Tax=Rhizobium loti TaxID=381 RepID=UPI00047C2183|nr:GGDEF domain-containing protein [Mesorhizobium loti]